MRNLDVLEVSLHPCTIALLLHFPSLKWFPYFCTISCNADSRRAWSVSLLLHNRIVFMIPAWRELRENSRTPKAALEAGRFFSRFWNNVKIWCKAQPLLVIMTSWGNSSESLVDRSTSWDTVGVLLAILLVSSCWAAVARFRAPIKSDALKDNLCTSAMGKARKEWFFHKWELGRDASLWVNFSWKRLLRINLWNLFFRHTPTTSAVQYGTVVSDIADTRWYLRDDWISNQ